VADVNIQQAPPEAPRGSGGGGGGSGAGWAVAVIILLAIVGWLVFGGGLHKTSTYKADVKIQTPGSAPSSAGGNVAPPSANPAPPSGGATPPSGGATPPKNP
jgi:hypothetical protein